MKNVSEIYFDSMDHEKSNDQRDTKHKSYKGINEVLINTVRDRPYHLRITQIRNTCIRNIRLFFKTNMSKLTVL